MTTTSHVESGAQMERDTAWFNQSAKTVKSHRSAHTQRAWNSFTAVRGYHLPTVQSALYLAATVTASRTALAQELYAGTTRIQRKPSNYTAIKPIGFERPLPPKAATTKMAPKTNQYLPSTLYSAWESTRVPYQKTDTATRMETGSLDNGDAFLAPDISRPELYIYPATTRLPQEKIEHRSAIFSTHTTKPVVPAFPADVLPYPPIFCVSDREHGWSTNTMRKSRNMALARLVLLQCVAREMKEAPTALMSLPQVVECRPIRSPLAWRDILSNLERCTK
ncbi:hypothetical protein C8J57DRAFT_1230849 [Mycena rebaudengoi]|nr:hypothetical protein C8J57DRAFT_1230849 [Mycena rebaudengoi]